MGSEKSQSVWLVGLLVVVLGFGLYYLFGRDNTTVSHETHQHVETAPAPVEMKGSKGSKGSAMEEVAPPSEAKGSDTGYSGQIKPATVTNTSQEQYSVQVYSFKDKKRADMALINLKNKGYDNAYVLVSDLGADKGLWHRVRVGNFGTEGEAKDMLMKLREDFNSGIIVRK